MLSLAPDLLVDPHPPFCNLKSLRLRSYGKCKEITPVMQDVLTYLLKKSPNAKIEMEELPKVIAPRSVGIIFHVNISWIKRTQKRKRLYLVLVWFEFCSFLKSEIVISCGKFELRQLIIQPLDLNYKWLLVPLNHFRILGKNQNSNQTST